jgi:predicted DNA-binding WGR domain protein
MRLVKQSILYFKEGNSDKVYEIDLCDVGNDKYVVNFRYGRRNAKLKEGSKTPVPVSLAEAEKLFSELEDEKISKGYTASENGISSIPTSTNFKLATDTTIGASFMSLPPGRTKGILQRLYNAVQGNTTSYKTKWKLSRVIWKAGEYKISEAAPYIIKLYNNGDVVHQYSATWALARCGNEIAIPALQQVFKEHSSPLVSKIAGAGLLLLLKAQAREEHLTHYLNSLPEPIKAAIEGSQEKELAALIEERIDQEQPQYNWLENLYLVSIEKRWVRPLVKKILQQIPLKPNYFKHVRSVFKQAELLDDFEISGMLVLRFEREREMFVHHYSLNDHRSENYYVQTSGYANPHKELRKTNSRLAYSQRTRRYLRYRVNRRLQMYGNLDSTDYVKLATGILLSYNKETDYKEAYATHDYKWNGRNYARTEIRFPQNAHAFFLHKILSGDHPELLLLHTGIWRLKTEHELLANKPQQQLPNKKEDGGLLKKITGIFGKKKEEGQPQPGNAATPQAAQTNENGTPFLHLWNKLPQSYVQLLMDAQLDEIHEFAQGGLTSHPQWNEIKTKLDKHACKKLLLSPFEIPAAFGLQLTIEKFAGKQADLDLVIAMLNSRNADARSKGKEWTAQYQAHYLQQSDFIKDLIFTADADIATWAKALIKHGSLSSDVKNVVVGKSIAHMMAFTVMNNDTEQLIKRASDSLFELFRNELQQAPLAIIADLLQHDIPPVLLFGLQLLRLKKEPASLKELNRSVLFGLTRHNYQPVRDTGLALMGDLPVDTLLQYADEVVLCCTSPYRDVRRGIAPVMARMAQQDRHFGEKAADLLMPCLLRKESSEGLHEDISDLLCKELSDYLQNANKELALNLLYGNYNAAQNVGVVILEKYTDPAQLTLPQVIALGAHENLNVRSWCWKFYSEQVPRIKYEKDAAVKLLDSKWKDTRQFAMQFFREQFTAEDWTPEALIALADSVKPDIEAYGRELITKFFTGDQGTNYLLKLSQHPSENMQLFATNYLERYAADDIEKIQSLEFYFRSVLTRVNKSRIAKNRLYHFLLVEGRKSETAASVVGAILTDVSAIAAIGDKAKCIEVLLQLKSLYEVETPLVVKEIELRS